MLLPMITDGFFGAVGIATYIELDEVEIEVESEIEVEIEVESE